jgi:hypothetical protein
MKFKGAWFNNQINLVEVLSNATLHNQYFNPNEWSICDAETLITIGNMIKREIRKEKNK